MKKEMVGGELVAALQKRGKVGEELEVALLKREMEVPLEEAQRLVEKVASQGGMPGGGTLVGRAGGITGGGNDGGNTGGGIVGKGGGI